MTRRIAFLLICATLAICCIPGLAEGVAFTDMAGREIALDAPAARIVALAASDCEILYALGAQDALVGRGEYCDYPEQIAEIPAVSSGAQTNMEQLLALSPQVALLPYMAQSLELSHSLEAAGVVVVNTNAQDVAGTYTAIELIGALTGKDDAARELVERMRSTFAGVADSARADGKTVYFEVSPLDQGLWTAGKGTFMDELAAMCGVANVFADVDGWAQISEEQVIARDPDYIVTVAMYYGDGPTPVEEIASRPGWQGMKAVRNGAILNADGNEISRPGPRLMNAATVLSGFFNGTDAAE